MNSSATNLHDKPHQAFISHSGLDKEVAGHICEALEASGIRCWIAPRDISPGKSWASSIIEAIVTCDVMVLVYSINSNQSPQCLREVERALQRKLHFITYRIDDTPPSDDLEYFLSTVQWLDAYSTDSKAHIDYLVESVHHVLDADAGQENKKPAPYLPASQSRSTPLKDKPSRRWSVPLMAFAAIALLSVIAWYALGNRGSQPGAPLQPVYQTETSRNMAVLPFQNLSQTPNLDWLRSGLSEMIITDLSQSDAFHVLSSQELFQAIASSDGEIKPVNSIDKLQQVGRSADVSSVLSGSFAKIGQTLEISIKVQNSLSGEILLAERASGPEDNVFSMIDGLTGLVREYFGQGSAEALDKDLREVTTDSLEAYRFYVEGLQFDLQLKREEAIPLLKRAVEIDPAFAMAHARLGWIYQNLGMAGESAASLNEALNHAERLPARERYLIQGLQFGQQWESYHLAEDAFRNALAVDPNLNSARHQLATLYGKLEMFTEAIELWESLREENYEYAGIENGLAIMYSTQDEFEKGEVLLQSLVRRDPSSNLSHVALGWHYSGWGKFEQAFASFAEARKLQASVSPFLLQAEWRGRILQGELDEGQKLIEVMLQQGNPYANWLGYKNQAIVMLLEGKSRQALFALEQAATAYSAPNAFTAMTWLQAADIYLQTGNFAEAIANAELAVEQGQGEWPEWEARFLIASAEYQNGNRERAETLAAEILAQAGIQPGNILKRMHHHLMGRFAMVRGDSDVAITELNQAAASLSARGFKYHFQREPDHASVWFDLAQAYLANGQAGQAAEWLQRISDSRIERTIYPLDYVRSYYYLGLANEQLDRSAAAKPYFQSFLDYWQGGDLFADMVTDAVNKVE